MSTPETVTIRKATHEDAAAICTVHTSAIRRTCSSAYGAREIESWAGALSPEAYRDPISTQVVLVAVREGVVVGFGQLKRESGQIEAVYVLPDQSGRGVGGRLLRALEGEAGSAGVRHLTLSATLNAVGFYARAGYRVSGSGRHRLPDGVEIECVPMAKDLSGE